MLDLELGVDAAEQRRLAHITARVLFFAFCDLGNGIFNWVANSESTGDFGYSTFAVRSLTPSDAQAPRSIHGVERRKKRGVESGMKGTLNIKLPSGLAS